MASAYEKRPGKFYARWKDRHGVWRHTATKARTKGEAKQIATELEQRAWRQRMGLEQLRALGNGMVIKVKETFFETFGVDTPEDLERVEKCLNISL